MLSNLIYFDQQVAGHDNLRMCTTNDTVIIKPCNQKEIDFYQDVRNYSDFQDFIPECYGTVRAATEKDLNLLDCPDLVEGEPVRIDTSQQSAQNLCLENILHGFTRPCIMDLKLGSILHEKDATEEKKKKMIHLSTSTSSSSIGLRITGMKVYDHIGRRYIQYSNGFGKSFTSENIIEGFLAFLFPHSQYALKMAEYQSVMNDKNDNGTPITTKPIPSKYTTWIIETFIDTLKEIRDAAEQYPQLSLIGSSLLFVYEGDYTAAHRTWKYMLDEDKRVKTQGDQEGGSDEELAPKMSDLRLIDFAHCDWHANRHKQDSSILMGLDNTVELLEECLKRQHDEGL